MQLRTQMMNLARRTKESAHTLELLSDEKKRKILQAVARELLWRKPDIMRANRLDMAYGEKAGLSQAMLDRLLLNEERIAKMAKAVGEVARLKDPIGEVIKKWKRPNGLQISQVRVPLGVILVIYESRPNVTSECASLCLKSGNAVILKGGREAIHSNKAIRDIYARVLKRHGLSEFAVSFVNTTDRKAVDELLQLYTLIDLAIPRGGEGLIRHCKEVSRIPLVKHDKGICHVYVDKDAELGVARKIVINAKCQRPSVCNAMETLLVHEKVAGRFLPGLRDDLLKIGCELRVCPRTQGLLRDSRLKKARAKDWDSEYLDLVLSIRIVRSLKEAIDHINGHSSKHTDSIVTRNKASAETFLREIDSSSVMVNASTRFSDGNEYGFGAEIGISTEKVHARGPMGLEGLTSYKYLVRGQGQVRT